MCLKIIRLLSAGKTKKVADLPAPFARIMLVRQERIQNIHLAVVDDVILIFGEERRHRHNGIIFRVLRIIKWPGGFRSLSGLQSELKTVK